MEPISKTVTMTVRIKTELMDRVEAEVNRLRKAPAWNLLKVNRNNLVVWALKRWLQEPLCHPVDLFRKHAEADDDVVPFPERCAICSLPISDPLDRTLTSLCGDIRVHHTTCLPGADGRP